MKLYPYSKIQTENLKGLLIASRVLGVLSYILLIITVCIGIYGAFSGFGGTKDLGNGITMTVSNSSGPAIMVSIWGMVSSVCVLAFSGLCAAVVSCEYKFTKTSE
ncbi:hypothetical protein [Pseudoalteromonas sp. DY56-GL79]|uniref:hypothetical protein n=1 Tax=Pseudoalteromonas sp. DY56-GL79 TaxID=2967131 RepID=UPI00352B6CE7